MTNNNADENRHSRLFICILVVAVIVLSAAAFVGFKFIQHEKRQSAEILSLGARVSKLSAEIRDISANDIEWLSDGFNYLAIGNSITWHDLSSSWWNKVGMAASDAEHDYFHIVSSYLNAKHKEFMGLSYNFSVWEVQNYDRDETLQYLNHYLSPTLDLITIQLAENAIELSTYKEDYESLINYIKKMAPKARILVVGDFWTKDNRNDLKISAVKAANVEFVPLYGIADNRDYYCGMGTIVFDNDGKEHIVEHIGVAAHPGDKGMQAIADRIISALQ